MNRVKMDRADRAKQFMPFDALRGLKEALREKERNIVPKIELTDDRKEVLDYRLHQVKKLDIITVVYFHDQQYLKITGVVSRIDPIARILRIVNTKIDFDDIYDIDGEKLQE